MKTIFNRGVLERGAPVPKIPQEILGNTLSLVRASLPDAALYGGSVVREALDSLNLGGKHNYVTVDVKTHYLLNGMIPAIPGWHTDGVPRSHYGGPRGPLEPDMRRQEGYHSPKFHLVFIGAESPTQFLEDRNVELECENNSANLYATVDVSVRERKDLRIWDLPQCVWYSWDWWELHRATPCQGQGYRVLIRVTESDFVKPEQDLNKMIRAQQNVYIQGSYGW